MATVPLSGTNVRLLRNVPFNGDYKNSRWFTSKTSQTNYFTTKPVVFNKDHMNFQKIEGKNFVSIDMNVDKLWGTNYMMFRNSDYGNKWFYAFVTKLESKNRSTTYVYFEIDVLQTWLFEMDFKPSYVVREHKRLWNSDGTPVINTVDEGLDYGLEYDIVYTSDHQVRRDIKWLVIVSKEPIDKDGFGEPDPRFIGTPQALNYYAVPFKNNGSSVNVYLARPELGIPTADPITALRYIYRIQTAVNNVVSIYVTDNIGVEHTYSSGDDTITFPNNSDRMDFVSLPNNQGLLYFERVRNFKPIESTVGNKYNGVTDGIKESKLLMHPYTTMVMDDFKGNRQEYKLEYIKGRNIDLVWKGSLGTSNFTSVGIKNYNYESYSSDNNKVSNETALINSNPTDIPVLSDYTSAYLQGNKNSIQHQKNQAHFSSLSGVAGNSVGLMSSALSGNAMGTVSSAIGAVRSAHQGILDIQGLQAKLKDIDNMPAQISKMGTNTAYDYGNDYNGVYLIKKQIKPEYIRILSDFFNMFGYKTNRVKIPNFRTRRYWNYVQTINANILGDFNNEDLQQLKNIFDNGITLWHTDDIGNYDLDNEVR